MSEELAIVDIAQELSPEAKGTYCSIQGGDRKTRAAIYNAMNNPTHKVADFINKTIKVKDVFVEMINMENEETGESQVAPRVVLIDDKGEAYQAVSAGMFNAVKNAIQVFGAPTWEEPLPFTIKQVNVKNGSMLTVDIDL